MQLILFTYNVGAFLTLLAYREVKKVSYFSSLVWILVAFTVFIYI